MKSGKPDSRFPWEMEMATQESKNENMTDEKGHASSVGALLHASRLRLGDDLRIVADTLHIRYIYLEAIEGGRFDELPGAAYAIGFIRSYADYLGLDSEEVVRRYKAESASQSGNTELVFPVPIPESSIPGGAIVFVGVIVAVLAYGGWYLSTAKDGFLAGLVSPVPERLSEEEQNPEPEIKSVADEPKTSEKPQPPAQEITKEEEATEPEESAEEEVEEESIAVTNTTAQSASVTTVPEASQETVQETVQETTPQVVEVVEEVVQATQEVQESAESQEVQESSTSNASAVAETVVEKIEEVAAAQPNEDANEAVSEPAEGENQSINKEPEIENPPSETVAENTPKTPETPETSETAATEPVEVDTTADDAAEETGEAEDEPAQSVTPAAETEEESAGSVTPADETEEESAESPSTAEDVEEKPVESITPVETSTPAETASASSDTASIPENRVYGSENENSRILVKARKNSWIQVRDNNANRLVMTRLLRAGDSYRVPDQSGLVLLTGNAGALEILVDGESVPDLGEAGKVRRNVVLDPDLLRQGTAAE